MRGLGCHSLSRILSAPFTGSLGTRRIPMNRVAGLVLVGLVLLLNVTLTQSQTQTDDAVCPADGQPSVECDAASNCFHHCCLSTQNYRPVAVTPTFRQLYETSPSSLSPDARLGSS